MSFKVLRNLVVRGSKLPNNLVAGSFVQQLFQGFNQKILPLPLFSKILAIAIRQSNRPTNFQKRKIRWKEKYKPDEFALNLNEIAENLKNGGREFENC